ncbi:transcriptional regulator [Pleomorphomonas diazotrophica]|uniref:Transcriptional regulator n=1 Tax=Pleomorphomonas diazotrophica TaxID=1166257 RepID=A0A1I4W7D1_9HYPH|nr:DJ-1/PfpI family protein [Pleomorphomonas diazotrophica]PKR87922.1 transcriptional regulator [Pleomorphomonas diazotrophica]SFN09267.1 DJ-1/PfpI family protein [Pleomorphomonas diazotrophica]
MSRKSLIRSGIALALLALVALLGFAGWVASLPSGAAVAEAPPVLEAEQDAATKALGPSRRARPLIAVAGLNDATETTDYLVPAGILRRADIADVVMLATGPGPVQLYPALKVEPDATIDRFDAAHPDGADYVIVPAMSRDDDPAMLAWLRQQAEKGARIIGVCAGGKVVGAAGLLDGRRATTHWYYLGEMLDRSPTIQYVADRRWVTDGRVTTTTGITASLPTMLTLIEAIAGPAKAEGVARELGLESWDSRHVSGAFGLTRPFATTVLANRAAVWRHETFGIGLTPGMDEVSLALTADAWSRTYRSGVVSFAPAPEVMTANGLRLIPDAADWPAGHPVSTVPGLPPARALDEVLRTIGERYGERTAAVVAMQLEYPRPGAAP